jgi:molybdenum cofactor cytidylyltransferase
MAPERAAIVLAAGASRRMGTPKALLPWGDTTLLQHAVSACRTAGAREVVVVLGPGMGAVNVDATTVVNPDASTGRSASIRLGAAALSEVPAAILVQSVDQPVSARVLAALFDAIERGAEVAQPLFGERRGHPICLAGTLLPELLRVNEESLGLRAVTRRRAVTEVAVQEEAVMWNLNDPSTYAAARPRA